MEKAEVIVDYVIDGQDCGLSIIYHINNGKTVVDNNGKIVVDEWAVYSEDGDVIADSNVDVDSPEYNIEYVEIANGIASYLDRYIDARYDYMVDEWNLIYDGEDA